MEKRRFMFSWLSHMFRVSGVFVCHKRISCLSWYPHSNPKCKSFFIIFLVTSRRVCISATFTFSQLHSFSNRTKPLNQFIRIRRWCALLCNRHYNPISAKRHTNSGNKKKSHRNCSNCRKLNKSSKIKKKSIKCASTSECAPFLVQFICGPSRAHHCTATATVLLNELKSAYINIVFSSIWFTNF